ncbi:hypothetical protein HU200_028209 [Digitaria exilis]|uniref:Uncharacterized protein n=1 Tax=Digitaria exilis TaxID=1010633 RepID=A0A835BWF3_9POAL|nr:hypothetical protein HU200_028209 [Digitaria exilis]
MRVHPAPRKRTIAVQRCGAAAAAAAAGALGGKKLRRLPHIFAKVLELPFAADADVSVEEDAAALRFVAAAVDGFSSPLAPVRTPSRSTPGSPRSSSGASPPPEVPTTATTTKTGPRRLSSTGGASASRPAPAPLWPPPPTPRASSLSPSPRAPDPMTATAMGPPSLEARSASLCLYSIFIYAMTLLF